MNLNVINKKVIDNKLSIDLNEYKEIYFKYKEIYKESSDIEIFYKYLLNYIGSIINSVESELVELLGWLRITTNDNGICFFIFESDEDYRNWMQARIYIYQSLVNESDIRLLNYIELSTINFIKDLDSRHRYEFDKNNIQLCGVKELIDHFKCGLNYKAI